MSTMEERIIFSENLQRLMDERGKTRNDLSYETGIKYPTICEWLNKRKYPRIDKIQLLADYFNVGKTDLIDKRNSITPSKGIRIPVLGSVPAGIPLEAIEDIVDYEEIPEAMAHRGEYFGLRVNGESMVPVFNNGDTVIIQKQDSADTGDYVVAMINGGEATLKRLKRSEEGIMLIPQNPEFFPATYTNEQILDLPVRIIGKVVELRRKF